MSISTLPAIMRGPAFNFQPSALPLDAILPDAIPGECKGIPAGVDGFIQEGPGVLRAISKTVNADGTRSEHLLTYHWALMPTGWRHVVLTCDCTCCTMHCSPSCRHAVAADVLLNQTLVKAALLAIHAGQTGPCEVRRAWARKTRCYGCGSATLYVHLYRPAEGYAYRQHDRKTICTGCGLWRHEA